MDEKLPADTVPVPSRNPNVHFASGGKLRLLTLGHLDGRTRRRDERAS
jgi:hypothetical protein